jgi:type I restriction enzyme S subunit
MAKLNDITHKIKLERAPIGSTPYLEIGDVNTSTKRITKKNKGSVAGAVIAPAKSILISKVRPTRGAVAFLTDELVVSGAFTVLTADESVCLPEFLYYQIAWNKDFHSYLGSRATGATYPTVKEKDILEYEIPILPGLDEQERMVTIFKEAEVLKHKREEADQKTIELFDALFANAFGNLDTTLLPKKLLKEATTFITDGTHLPPPFTSEGIPFLFVRNITKGFIDFNTEKFVSEESYIKLTKKYRPEKYDILYSTVSPIKAA